MKKLLTVLMVVTSLVTFAQSDAVINDANAQQRNLKESFSAISVTDGIDLYLTKGSQESIAVSASDDKYFERYKTEVENGVLKIYYDNKGINWTGNEKRKLKAYVSFKTLQKINASGGAAVIMKSVLAANKMQCTFTSGSRFTGEVNIGGMDINENSGALIDITGKAANLKIDASSGSVFKGYELASDYCSAKASSGGSVRINLNKELNVKASSGGGIRYKGNGVIKEMDVSSGGNVKKG